MTKKFKNKTNLNTVERMKNVWDKNHQTSKIKNTGFVIMARLIHFRYLVENYYIFQLTCNYLVFITRKNTENYDKRFKYTKEV